MPIPMNTQQMTRPINARFAGICRATGDHYDAGTPIIKGPYGWQIADVDDDTAACPDGCPCHGDHNRAPQSRCEYCDTPTGGTVCDRCARACGEDAHSDGYDDFPDHGDDDDPGLSDSGEY